MNTVSVKALVDCLREAHKVIQCGLGHDDVGRGEGFALVQAPDVEFVDGEHAGDLRAR